MATEKELPKHLGKSGRALWSAIAVPYDLRVDEEQVLLRACETADRIDALNAALVGANLIVRGSLGQDREHPLLSEVRQQIALQARLLAQLKLPDDDAGTAASTSSAGRKLALARHHPGRS